MEEIIKLSLLSIFAHFMINSATIFSYYRRKIFTYIDIIGGKDSFSGWVARKFRYMMACVFCLTFWITLFISPQNAVYTPVVSVILYNFFKSN
jgi:hypothetical protein